MQIFSVIFWATALKIDWSLKSSSSFLYDRPSINVRSQKRPVIFFGERVTASEIFNLFCNGKYLGLWF
jgi:hypothetical protein